VQHQPARRRVVAQRHVLADADQVDLPDLVVGNVGEVDRGGAAGGHRQRVAVEQPARARNPSRAGPRPRRDAVRVHRRARIDAAVGAVLHHRVDRDLRFQVGGLLVDDAASTPTRTERERRQRPRLGRDAERPLVHAGRRSSR